MSQFKGLIEHIRQAALRDESTRNSDGALVSSFIERKDEIAFETLVRRYGPMVFGVCRRVTRNHQDAEDAFQATFVVLAHKAASIRPREMVGSWLYGVAYRTSLKARSIASKRSQFEKTVPTLPETEAPIECEQSELTQAIDQELHALGDRYRLPIMLCDLEGKTIQEAMQQLGWPQGTVAGRLFRGRKLLGKRLASRGLVFSSAAMAAIGSSHSLTASMSSALIPTTINVALLMSAGESLLGGGVSPNVATLFQGMLKMMMLSKLKTAAGALCVVAVLIVSGGGLLELQRAKGQAVKEKTEAKEQPAKPTNTGPVYGLDPKEKKWVDELNKGISDLPRGPFPLQARIKLSDDQKFVTVQTLRGTFYTPMAIEIKGIQNWMYAPKDHVTTVKYKCDELLAYVVEGEKLKLIEKNQLPKLLKKETLGMVYDGSGVLDARNFRLTKEGTLVLYLPATEAPPFVDDQGPRITKDP